MYAAAADIVGVVAHAVAQLGGFAFGFAESLRMALAVVPSQLMVAEDGPFVMMEIGRAQMRALLKQHHRMPGPGKLLGDDAAGGAGAHNNEIDFFAGLEIRPGHRYRPPWFI